jgi:hypothetical protein
VVSALAAVHPSALGDREVHPAAQDSAPAVAHLLVQAQAVRAAHLAARVVSVRVVVHLSALEVQAVCPVAQGNAPVVARLSVLAGQVARRKAVRALGAIRIKTNQPTKVALVAWVRASA